MLSLRLYSCSSPPTSECFCYRCFSMIDADVSIAFTPLIVTYTVEIMPFALRAKGLNVFNFTISVALIFNQYVNPIALGNLLQRSFTT